MLNNGDVLQERYRVVKPLGQGGMGAVYRAWDLRLKVPVAVKEMQPQPGLNAALLDGLRTQFEQEAAILARLGHPNLVRVTDYFEENGFAYLVMDFVEGQSLAEVIIQQGAQPEAQVIGWATQLLTALEYCHDQGVVHRDIKPQNIIIKPDGRVVLVDFGLVKLWDPTDPRTKTVMRGMGTPEYAPPEQYGASADHTGPPSDIYSIGATLYHALTGQAPPTATERMALPERFAPLGRLAPGINPNTERVVMRALTLAQSERWPTAEAMRTALTGGAPSMRSEPVKRGYAPPPQHYAPPPLSATRPASQPMPGQPPTRPPSQPMPGQSTRPPSQPLPGQPAQQHGAKWYTWLIGIGGALLCLMASCVGLWLLFQGDGGGTPSNTPTSGISVQPNTPTASGGFELTLLNASPYAICYVYISPSESTSWGSDWLAETETLSPNATRTFSAAADTYDVLLRTCDQAVIETAWELSGVQSITVGGAGKQPVWIDNQTDVSICLINISASDATDWGSDMLGQGETIPTGNGRIFFVTPGDYDLRAQDCDLQTLAETYNVTVAQEFRWVVEP